MNFLKNLFQRKKKSDLIRQEENDLQNLAKMIKSFESYDDNQIKNLQIVLNQLKYHHSKASESIHELFDSGLEYAKYKRSEKIVNEYGKAIMEATELNKRKVEEFRKKTDDNSLYDSRKEFQDKSAIFYHLQNKFDIRLLPYDKNTIKEAIEYLIQNDTDVKWLEQNETDVIWIEQLKIGLLFLDDFIDFSQFDS